MYMNYNIPLIFEIIGKKKESPPMGTHHKLYTFPAKSPAYSTNDIGFFLRFGLFLLCSDWQYQTLGDPRPTEEVDFLLLYIMLFLLLI